MRFAFQGCCFRVEVELFAPAQPLDRRYVAPLRERFRIERQLRKRLARELEKTRLPRESSEG